MNTHTHISPMRARSKASSPRARAAALAGLCALGVLFAPMAASACGGFFCFTQPIDQSAERILYIQEGGTITVHIQISYTGDDDQFSWILPLPSQPTLGIGSDSIFSVLEMGTAPRFNLQWQNTPNCWAGQTCALAEAGGRREDSNGGGGDGVTVLAQEKVGPYETVTIKGNSGAELLKWLSDNGYQQPAEAGPMIDQYAKGGYVFLALKLQKDKSSGDLAPIVVTLDETSPCLPLRLTAIAAAEDMPVVAWVLAEHRAIPKNFLHVEINEATVDWLQPGSNYKSVVSKAVDQASGHAFTTELARPTSKLNLSFAQPGWDPNAWAKISDPGEMIRTLLEAGIPRTTQLQELIRKHIPKPAAYASVEDQAFYNCIQCDGCSEGECGAWKAAVAAQGFDGAKMAADLDTYVVAPLKAVQQAFTTIPYLTRLYTLVSPAEMNKDPIFAFNKELGEVDNEHVAKATPICDPGESNAHSVLLQFASGHELTVPVPKEDRSMCFNLGFGGPIGVGQGSGPINDAGGQPAWKVEVLDETGTGIEIDPRDADLVDAKLNEAKAGTPSLDADFIATLQGSTWDPTKPEHTPNKGPSASSGGGGGCSASRAGVRGGDGAVALLFALVAGLVAVARRRRLDA